jgi:hypothetical protein
VERAEDEHVSQLVHCELELRDDAEVPASAAQAPEQVGKLVLTRAQDAPVRGHDLGRDEAVDRQAEPAHHPADTAAEGQSAHPGVRDDAGRHEHAVRLRRPVQLAEQRPATDDRTSRQRIHTDVIDAPEVDDDPAVTGAVAGHAVAASAHRDREIVRDPVANRGHDVVRRAAVGDERRPSVVHGVPDRTTGLVPGVAGDERSPSEPRNRPRTLPHRHREPSRQLIYYYISICVS